MYHNLKEMPEFGIMPGERSSLGLIRDYNSYVSRVRVFCPVVLQESFSLRMANVC